MVVSSLSQSRIAREVSAAIVTVASRDEGAGRSHFRKNAISAPLADQRVRVTCAFAGSAFAVSATISDRDDV